MRILHFYLVIFCIVFSGLLSVFPAAAQSTRALSLRGGRVDAVVFNGHKIDIDMGIRIYAKDWEGSTTNDPWHLQGVRHSYSERDKRDEWRGSMALPGGDGVADYTIRMQSDDKNNRIGFNVSLSPKKTMDMEGAYYEVLLPVSTFGGGTIALSRGKEEEPQKIALPARQQGKVLGTKEAVDIIQVTGANNGLPELRFVMGRDNFPQVVIEDARAHGEEAYMIRIRLLKGPFAHSRGGGLSMSLEAKPVPVEMVRMDVQLDKERYAFRGFGGNYCFQIDSPHTLYTLENLQPKVARVEMSLKEWEPENDNASPVATDMRKLERNDQPDTKLRRELQLASEIQSRGIPMVISVWELPRWLYVDGGKQEGRNGPVFGSVSPRLFDELAESVGSYLTYAQWKYAVEPDYFSFNEPDIGMRVQMSADEHERALLVVAEELERRNLKTRILVGGVANMEGTLDYVQLALKNRRLRELAGGIAIHSWNGASPETSRAWSALAREHQLPLFVTEMGFDPFAHQHKQWLNSYNYAMREAELYQALLRDAQPQATWHWQFTEDYSLLKEEAISTTQTQLVPTDRYNFMGHLSLLTPGNSVVLGSESSDPDTVWISAFKGPQDAESKSLAIHILNTSAERPASIGGLGALRQPGQMYVSTEGAVPEVKDIAVPAEGALELTLPARGLLTLVFPNVP